MDKEALKKNVPNIVFGSIEGEELKKFMDALNSIAARFGKHIDDGAYVLVGKTESRVGYSVYNSKGCQVYYEIVSKETWEKFMDFIFGGSGA